MKIKKTLRDKLCGLLINWAAPVECGLLFLLLFKFNYFWGCILSTSMESAIKKFIAIPMACKEAHILNNFVVNVAIFIHIIY
jgi:hypothetical protein